MSFQIANLPSVAYKSKLLAGWLGLILLMTLAFASGQLQAQTFYEGENFSLEIPQNWEIYEQQSEGDIQEFIFLVPEEVEEVELEKPGFAANVNVAVEELTEGFTLEEYVDIVLLQLESSLSEFEKISRREVLLAGEPGISIKYSGITAADEELIWQEWITIKNDFAYVIAYTARQEDFSDHQSEIDHILTTFSLVTEF